MLSIAVVLCWLLLPRKLQKALNLKFCVHKALSKVINWILFTMHLHLLQWFIQAVLYMYESNNIMSFLTVHILFALYIS